MDAFPSLLRTLAQYALFLGVAGFLMLNVHEIGHTVFARLFGDRSASYALYRLQPNGSVACIGCNAYDESQLSFLGNAVVTLGGVLFTQGLALLLLWYGGRSRNAPCRGFCAVLMNVCLFDAVVQVAQGLAADTARQTALTRVDLADFVWLLSNRMHAAPGLLQGSILAVLIAYLWGFRRLYRKTAA